MSKKERPPHPPGSWGADWEAAKPILIRWMPVIFVVTWLATWTYMDLTH